MKQAGIFASRAMQKIPAWKYGHCSSQLRNNFRNNFRNNSRRIPAAPDNVESESLPESSRV
jgi:hypothetical protein